MKITSLSNPLIKDLLKLYKRKYRDDTNLFILEGKREIERLSPDFEIVKIFTTEAQEFQEPCYEISQKVFEKISIRGERAGSVIVAKQRHYGLQDFFHALPKNPKLLILDGVQKPGNVGAILRSASAFGMSGVILSDCPIDLYNPNLLRSAISSIQSVPILTSDARSVIDELNKRQIALFASSLDQSQCLSNTDFTDAFALVLGSEDKGVSQAYLESALQKVQIFMNKGAVDSLNVSVAAACFCYEIHRRKTHLV